MEERTKRKRKRNSIVYAIVVAVGVMIGILAPPLIGSLIWYNTKLEIYQNELDSYSTDVYEYLFKSVNLIFREDEGVIDINAKPEDIILQEFFWDDSEKKFKCKLYLENRNIKRYFPVQDITVEISPELKIISTESEYSSKEKLMQFAKNNIEREALMMGFAIIVFETIVIMWISLIQKIRGSTRKK